MIAALIGVAGALGAVGRYLLDRLLRPRTGPWATVVINLLGSFAIGLAIGLGAHRRLRPALAPIVMAGFCGGFTTLSTSSVDIASTLKRRRPVMATALAVGTLAGSLAAVVLGRYVGER